MDQFPQKPDVLLDAIRRRPGMYFGTKSLSALSQFSLGYQTACHVHQIESEMLPRDFHDWVAYRCHFRESTSGWCNMILSETPSEESAFDRFFQLLDEHSERAPKLVAELVAPTSETWTVRDGQKFVLPAPAKIQLVKYTNDPGFFALFDSNHFTDRFVPFLSWLDGFSGGDWVIHDAEAHAQMQRRDAEWQLEVLG